MGKDVEAQVEMMVAESDRSRSRLTRCFVLPTDVGVSRRHLGAHAVDWRQRSGAGKDAVRIERASKALT